MAYKLLKPVKTSFLDQSTIERRAAAVLLEVELNRRLAPDIYLGVSPIVTDTGTLDHMIVMRRLPAERRLSALVNDFDFDNQLRAVAKKVAAFHAQLEPDQEAVDIASVNAERTRWQNNIDELADIAGPSGLDEAAVGSIMALVATYLEHRHTLFEDRARQGFAREGHGDLLAADIFCMDDGPRILDCLAFDPALRKGDVLADIAFLVMDIERLAGPRAGQRVLRWYQEFSNEHHPASLAHFYVAYRALVRCKIGALRYLQTRDGHDRIESIDFLNQSLDHLNRAVPRVVLLGGGPGTGKSTLARTVSDIMGWPVLSSDEVRKNLAHHDHTQHAFATPDTGLYTPERTEATYAELNRQAAQLLVRGESVILDASWSADIHRAEARAGATALGAAVIELECLVEPAIAKERILRRMSSPWTVSDATPEIVDHLAKMHDPWPEAVTVDTTRSKHHSRSEALKAVLGFTGPSATTAS